MPQELQNRVMCDDRDFDSLPSINEHYDDNGDNVRIIDRLDLYSGHLIAIHTALLIVVIILSNGELQIIESSSIWFA